MNSTVYEHKKGELAKGKGEKKACKKNERVKKRIRKREKGTE